MENPILNLIKQKHPGEENVLLWFYSVMLETDKSDHIETISQYLLKEYSDDKFTCLLSYISNQKIDDFRCQLLVNNKFNTQKFTYTLPDAVYLICISPIKDERINFAKEIIRAKVGLIRICLGNGIAKELILEQILSVDDGELKGESNDIILHKEIEGPSHDLLLIKDIMNKINIENGSNKTKFLRALKLIDFAATCNEQDMKFSLYFIAIDTLLPTFSSKKIYNIMKNHYSKNEKYIKEDLGIEIIIQARHDSFHDGLLFRIGQETERYMQIFCYEMIRAILELPCLRLLESHINKFPLNLKSYNIAQQILG